MSDENGEVERGPTKRTVLVKVRALVISDDTSDEQIQEAIAALTVKRAKPATVEAWQVVGEFEGHSKDAAIRVHAGEPGTPHAKLGDFKAPTTSAWKGGSRYIAPPLPLVTREEIE